MLLLRQALIVSNHVFAKTDGVFYNNALHFVHFHFFVLLRG